MADSRTKCNFENASGRSLWQPGWKHWLLTTEKSLRDMLFLIKKFNALTTLTNHLQVGNRAALKTSTVCFANMLQKTSQVYDHRWRNRMIQNRLDNRSRKRLGFKTSAEVFHQFLKRVGIGTWMQKFNILLFYIYLTTLMKQFFIFSLIYLFKNSIYVIWKYWGIYWFKNYMLFIYISIKFIKEFWRSISPGHYITIRRN